MSKKSAIRLEGFKEFRDVVCHRCHLMMDLVYKDSWQKEFSEIRREILEGLIEFLKDMEKYEKEVITENLNEIRKTIQEKSSE